MSTIGVPGCGALPTKRLPTLEMLELRAAIVANGAKFARIVGGEHASVGQANEFNDETQTGPPQSSPGRPNYFPPPSPLKRGY